jgi:hypothetical protein
MVLIVRVEINPPPDCGDQLQFPLVTIYRQDAEKKPSAMRRVAKEFDSLSRVQVTESACSSSQFPATMEMEEF